MNKRFTFWQKLLAAYLNTNAKWLFSSNVEKLIMEYKSLSEEEQKEFFEKILDDLHI